MLSCVHRSSLDCTVRVTYDLPFSTDNSTIIFSFLHNLCVCFIVLCLSLLLLPLHGEQKICIYFPFHVTPIVCYFLVSSVETGVKLN